MTLAFDSARAVCERHRERLSWAMNALRPKFPLAANALAAFSDEELAVLDQFMLRFSKLQDAMGAKLFPAVLDLTKEPDELVAFVDKLNRLERLGAVPSAERWLLMREARNAFSHDYPDDPELQAALLNRAFALGDELMATLDSVERFARKYL